MPSHQASVVATVATRVIFRVFMALTYETKSNRRKGHLSGTVCQGHHRQAIIAGIILLLRRRTDLGIPVSFRRAGNLLRMSFLPARAGARR